MWKLMESSLSFITAISRQGEKRESKVIVHSPRSFYSVNVSALSRNNFYLKNILIYLILIAIKSLFSIKEINFRYVQPCENWRIFCNIFKGNGTWNNPFDSFDESWSKYGNRRLLYLFPPITLEQWLIKKGVTEENTVVIKRGSASIELDRPCILKSWRLREASSRFRMKINWIKIEGKMEKNRRTNRFYIFRFAI